MIKDYHLLLILFVIFIVVCECKKDNNTNLSEQFVMSDSDNNGFDLRSIQTMTFFKNRFTKGSRTNPIPQLSCVGGNACGNSHVISSVQCTNNGVDENDDVQWKCSANLPSNLTLNNTNVNCEGLTNNLDKIKLKGSCGLEYNLDNSSNYTDTNNSYISIIIIIIFLLFAVAIYFAINAPHPIRYYYDYTYPEYYSPYYRRHYDYGYTRYDHNYGSFGNNNIFNTSKSGYGSTKTR